MNELITPSAPVRNSSYLPSIKDKENERSDSTVVMDRSNRCVNAYHVEKGKVYFPYYKLTGDGKTQNKSVYFDLDELRQLIKNNVDTNGDRNIEPIPEKCISQGDSVVSIITPTLKLYPTESASQSGELTTNMTRDPTIVLSTDGGITESSQNKMIDATKDATKNVVSHQPTLSPSSLYTIASSKNVTPTAGSIHSAVDATEAAVDSIAPTTESRTPTAENITPAMSNATLTSEILVAPTVPPTVNMVDDFLSAAVASTSIGRLRNDLVEFQKAHPRANISTLLDAVDETLAFYKFVSLVTKLSFFIDSIKTAHPEAASYYKNQLRTLLNTINQHYDKKSTSDRTRRSPWIFAKVLENLVKFESAPMKAEMLSFFKGFEDTRVELTNAVHSGFSLSPELRTLIDTLQSSGKNLVKLMEQVNKETANLLAESNYYRVGRLAFKANLLTESYKVDSVINELKTEIDGACKNTFSELIERYSNLQNLPAGMNADVPLNEVMNFSFTYDPLQIARLANQIGEGFCRADSLLSAISGQEGTLLKSLDGMVKSVFNGVGYAKYPYQLRFILQERFYSDVVSGLNNALSSVGAKPDSIQVKNALEVFNDYYRSENKVPFKSAEDLLRKTIVKGYRDQLRVSNDLKQPVQHFIRPAENHVAYMEVKSVGTGYRLTFQDIRTGLKVVNGKSLSSLIEEATRKLREVFIHYKIPLTDASAYSAPPSSNTVTHAFNSQAQLDKIGQLQIIPDSALTIKDVVTHDISELKELDKKAIKSMFEEYTKLQADPDIQKKLKLDNVGDKLPDVPASTTQIDRSDHLISQVREVIAAIKDSVQTGKAIPNHIKLLNSHILVDMLKDAIKNPSTSTPDQPSSSSGGNKLLKSLNIPDNLPAGQVDISTLMQMGAIKDFMDIFDSGVHQLKRKLSDKDRQPEFDKKEAKKPNIDKTVEGGKKPDFDDGARYPENDDEVDLSSFEELAKALAAAAAAALALLLGGGRALSSQEAQQLGNSNGNQPNPGTGGSQPNPGTGGGNAPGVGGGGGAGFSCTFWCKFLISLLFGVIGIAVWRIIENSKDLFRGGGGGRLPPPKTDPTPGGNGDGNGGGNVGGNVGGKDKPNVPSGGPVGILSRSEIIAAVTGVPETRSLTLGSTAGDFTTSSTQSNSAVSETGSATSSTLGTIAASQTSSATSSALSTPAASETSSAINSMPGTLTASEISSAINSTLSILAAGQTSSAISSMHTDTPITGGSAVSQAVGSMEGMTTHSLSRAQSPMISSLPSNGSFPDGVQPPGFLANSGSNGLKTSGTALAGVNTELLSSDLGTIEQGSASAFAVDSTANASHVSLATATVDSELSPTAVQAIPESSTADKATTTPSMPDSSDIEGHFDVQGITNTFNNITADLYKECEQKNQIITDSLKLNDYGSAREDHKPSSVELHQNFDLCTLKQLMLADATMDSLQNNRILIAKSNSSFIEIKYPERNEIDLIPSYSYIPDKPSDAHKIRNLLFNRASFILKKGFFDITVSKTDIAKDIANSFEYPFYHRAMVHQLRESYAILISDLNAFRRESIAVDKIMDQVQKRRTLFENKWTDFWNTEKVVGINHQIMKAPNIVAVDFTRYQADMYQKSVELMQQIYDKFTSSTRTPLSYQLNNTQEHGAGSSMPIFENHNKDSLFNNSLAANRQNFSQPELNELFDLDSMKAGQLYDDYVQNLEAESAHAENPGKGTIISGTQVFRNSFEIHALERLREGNSVVYDVGKLFLGALLDSAPTAERQKKMREILGVKELLLHQQMSSLQRMYDAYFTIRSNMTVNQQIPAGISSGNLDKVADYTEKFKTDTGEVLSKTIEGIRATDTTEIDTYIDDRKDALLELRNTMINDLQALPVTQEGTRESSTERRLTRAAGDLVQETTRIVSKCLSLFKQIAFDLKTRFNDPEVYKTRDLIPADFLDSSDDQTRKRRDVASTDENMIDENMLLNSDWQDSAMAEPDHRDSLEPAHSSGSSLHSGIFSDIRARLSGLASFAGLDSPAHLAQTGYVPPNQESIHGSSSGQKGQALRTQTVPYNSSSSLILANVMAAAINDRPLRTADHQVLNSNSAGSLPSDPVRQSPGMKLLEGSRRIAGRLQAEVTDFVQALTNNEFAEVATCWQPEDLLNIAIVQTAGSSDPSPVTEAFLQTVLASGTLGVEHESPDNIFRSDGTVRNVAVGADGQSSIFYDSVTGKTTTGSPSVELARCMLQAMAQHQLKKYGTQGLSPSFSQKVLDQARLLRSQQHESIASQLGNWLGISENKAEQQFDKHLSELFAASHQPVPETIHSIPLIQSLDMGNYQDTRQQFMELLPEQQLAMLQSLARAPDPLGLDQSRDYLAQWQTDIKKLSCNSGYSDHYSDQSVPDWSAFAIRQRAWQLFSYLYDCKVSAPQEALARVQLSSAINQRRMTDDDDEGLELNRVVTAFLPEVSSASEGASIELGSVDSLQPPVQRHRFNRDNIDRMLDAYSAIKKQVKDEFPRVFGHTIHDPQLQQELTGQVAIVCLEALKGRLSDNTEHWQSLVKNVLEEEFAEFNGLSSG